MSWGRPYAPYNVYRLIGPVDKMDRRQRHDELAAVGEVTWILRPDRIDVAPGEHDHQRRLALGERGRRQDRDIIAGTGHHIAFAQVVVDQEVDFVLEAKLRQQRSRSDRD